VPSIELTRCFIREVECPAGVRKVDFFDTRQTGFMVEVRNSGGKTYYQRYRDQRGFERQYKIGPTNVLSLSQARRKALAIRAEAVLGNDPHRRRKELREIPTLAIFTESQYLPYARDAKRSWKTDEAILRLHILPVLGRLPLDEISNQLIAGLLQRLREQGYASGTTNRVLVLLRFMFNLAKKWGVPNTSDNPTVGLATVPDVCRERYLSEQELDNLLSALDSDENQVAAKAIKLLLLTGARRNEVTHAKWEYVDWAQRTLLVPIAKTGRPRLIALNGAALELLRAVPRIPDNPYIFPSPITGRPSKSMHFPWTRIRRVARLKNLRLHDLRHSFASFLVNGGVSLYVVQGLLGHTQPRMTQRYAHLAQDTLLTAAEVVGQVVTRGEPMDVPGGGFAGEAKAFPARPPAQSAEP
jgi:integrase